MESRQDKLVKVQAYDLLHFIGQIWFGYDGIWNYLVFQILYDYFRKIVNNDNISVWESKALSEETIKPLYYI